MRMFTAMEIFGTATRTAMRTAIVLAVLAGISLALPAEAASRHKHHRKHYTTITVQPRSFLDPGTEVPVGSMQHYVFDMMPQVQAAQIYPGRVGTDVPLPARETYRGVAVDIPAPDFLRK